MSSTTDGKHEGITGRKKSVPYERHYSPVSFLGVFLVVVGGLGTVGVTDDLGLMCWHCPRTAPLSESSPRLLSAAQTQWLIYRWWMPASPSAILLRGLESARWMTPGRRWLCAVPLSVRVLRRSRCHRIAAAGPVSHLRLFYPRLWRGLPLHDWDGDSLHDARLWFHARMTSICVCVCALLCFASVFQWKDFPIFDFINVPSKCSQRGLSQAEGITYLKLNEYVQLEMSKQ